MKGGHCARTKFKGCLRDVRGRLLWGMCGNLVDDSGIKHHVGNIIQTHCEV